MAAKPSVAILDYFSALSDPREGWRVVYPLPEILLVVLCATLSGMEDFVEIRLWGEQSLSRPSARLKIGRVGLTVAIAARGCDLVWGARSATR